MFPTLTRKTRKQGPTPDLIAAAPELLEALEGLLFLADLPRDDVVRIQKAYAAIDKARGQEHET